MTKKKEKSKENSSNWGDIYNIFKEKLTSISKLEEEYSKLDGGKNKFIYETLKEVGKSVERQLGEVQIFEPLLKNSKFSKEEVRQNKALLDAMKNAPLTNSGCESENAYLGMMCSQTGGSASLQTLSKKRVISKNEYLKCSEITSATDEQRQTMWKWSRTSDAAKSVKEIEQTIVKDVRASRDLALEVKKEE